MKTLFVVLVILIVSLMLIESTFAVNKRVFVMVETKGSAGDRNVAAPAKNKELMAESSYAYVEAEEQSYLFNHHEIPREAWGNNAQNPDDPIPDASKDEDGGE
ncbi:OLC1v1034463C1 [Oldenlandia corymbosa var. corymbosa]|uniref:OLC1v1034463C1 n=1 Tax=Oldenlandia corymbosa var. corymbosa TaxID=529605 RepID=A0AAV1CRZ1_OLDCO|nr:OLC1v1034463C1 [Oldenlandia corymbosa var. corymbosa]